MKREVKIGIFAVLMICCAWAGIRFLSGVDVFRRSNDYYVEYDQVVGIHSASSVMIQGVKVGTVTAINLDPKNSDKVLVTLSIERQYDIPADSKAKIFSPGLMSSMAIGIDMGQSTQMLSSGDHIEASIEKGLMDIAGDELANITQKLATTLDSVNSLLETNSGSIEGTLSNLNTLSSQLNALIASQRSNIDGVLGGFAEFSETLGNNSEQIESMITNLNTLSHDLSEADLGNGLTTTLDNLNSTLAKLNEGEGSMGKLMNDEELYENLTALSGSIDALMIDLQENPKRYVHFSLFGRKDKEE